MQNYLYAWAWVCVQKVSRLFISVVLMILLKPPPWLGR